MRTNLECSAIRDTNRDIGQNGESLVGANAFEGQIVCDFVDCQKQIVIERSPDSIRAKDKPDRCRA